MAEGIGEGEGTGKRAPVRKEMEKELKAEKRKVREEEKKRIVKQKQSAATAKLQKKLSVAEVEVTRLTELLKKAGIGKVIGQPTRPTMVEKVKGKANLQRTSNWNKRSRAMATVGKMIHGDAEGFLCDILYQATSTEKRIDSILEMPRVVDRLVLPAISSSEMMYYAWLYLVLLF